jgi:ATP-dependent helicase HrpA
VDPRITELLRALDACATHAAVRLRRRLEALGQGGGHAADGVDAAELRAIRRAIESSAEWVRRRRETLPRARFDEALPIAARREEIQRAIGEHQVVVVCGETGSGKSTQLPLICLEAGLGARGLIGHTQPRRIAARTIAQRLGDELGVGLGRAVGYKVRFDDATDPDTVLKVMTDGVLLAEMQRDRRLSRYEAIIIDEAHERSLNIDFLLGYMRRLVSRRPELRVVITSATIDPARFSRHFGGAPVIEVSGRVYPVEVRYRPGAAAGEEGGEADPAAGLIEAVEELAREGPGDVLVFLPGEREIHEAERALREGSPVARGGEVLPLYARLAAKDQLRAFQPHERRRIILATNIAETSITVPGVHYVVDSGLARVSRYGSRSRVQGLEIEPISQASANQRAGRCGRVADGVCIRLYGEEDFRERPAFTDPEILRSNLAGVVLRMKALRLGDPAKFPFIDRPSPRRIRDGIDTLVELGALDEAGELTQIGRRLAAMPIDPRLGRMILAAAEEGCLREVLVLAAALATRDPRERPLEARERADAAHAQFVDHASDFLTLLNIWKAYRAQHTELSSRKLRRWCAERFLSSRGLREWEDLHEQLRRMVRQQGHRVNHTPAKPESIHRALLAGLLSNVGVRGEKHEYQGANGTEFFVHPGSVLFERKPRWVVAAEMVRTTRVYARMVAPVHAEWIETLGAHLLERTHSSPTWDDRAAAPVVVERVSLFGIQLPSKRRIPYGRINPTQAREIFIRRGLVEGAYRPPAPFVEHNDRLIQHVRRLEAKARRRDRQGEAGARFDFFERRVPPDVWSGKSFDRWRHRAEARRPDLLFMREEDLALSAEAPIQPAAYPDAVEVGGRERELEYHYEPGEADDGVVLTLPIAAFNELTEAELDWMVPGIIQERAVEMLRSLPKLVRRGIGPAPQVVHEFLSASPDRARPLADALADYVARTRGVSVGAADLRLAPIPAHVRPKVVVTDAEGHVLASGRDLAELRREVSGEVDQALNAGESLVAAGGEARSWQFGELPESTTVSTTDSVVTAFPAVVDRERAVVLRLLPEREQAAEEHRRGVRRLLAIRFRRQVQRELSQWPGMGAMRLAKAAVGIEASLEDELGLLAIDLAAGEAVAGVRSGEAFEALAEAVGGRLERSLLDAISVVERILERARRLVGALEGSSPASWQGVRADIDEQLALLLPAQPFSTRPWEQLRRFPRYLEGAELRLKKLSSGGLDRDQRRARELEPRWRRWAELEPRLSGVRASERVRRELDEYRWLLEEFRVSLFAQELGTAERVSGARLDERWAGVREAIRADGQASTVYAVPGPP